MQQKIVLYFLKKLLYIKKYIYKNGCGQIGSDADIGHGFKPGYSLAYLNVLL